MDNFQDIGQKGEVALLEALLEVNFPQSYKDFLFNKGHTVVDGFPILGLPINPELSPSVLGATELLRAQRPDLPKSLCHLWKKAILQR